MDPIQGLAAIARRCPDFRGKVQIGWRLMRHRQASVGLCGHWDFDLLDGDRFSLPLASKMTWTAAFRGHYDRPHRRLVESAIQPGTLVLDIGAALGLWTVPLGRHAHAVGARVWAFEPHPSNVPWLRRNVELNELADVVQIQELALGDRPGVATMRIAEEGRGGVGNAFVTTEIEADGARVAVAPLDQIELPCRVSVMKIDVEGFEVSVLRGAWNTILRDRPTIFAEFNAEWLAMRSEDLSGLLDSFLDADYEIFSAGIRRARPWSATERGSLTELHRGFVGGDLLIRPRRKSKAALDIVTHG